MDDVTGLFDQLCGCLKTQEEIIDRLIAAGEAQLKAVKENNIIDVNETVKEQEACAAVMEETEQQRLLLQSSLEEVLKVEKGLSLSKLLPFAPESARPPLQQLLEILKKKMASLEEINTLNAALIKKALLVNGRLIQILHSGPSTTYGVKGEIESKSQSQPRSVLNESI